jgi:phosphoserine aminotransferase
MYIALLNLRYLQAHGGVAEAEIRNRLKAETLYAELDRNALFEAPVNKADRSIMNVCFFPKQAQHQQAFLDYCQTHHIKGLKGHLQAGGFRASLYNAVTIEHVQTLVDALQQFEKLHA